MKLPTARSGFTTSSTCDGRKVHYRDNRKLYFTSMLTDQKVVGNTLPSSCPGQAATQHQIMPKFRGFQPNRIDEVLLDTGAGH
eukprot:4469410-Pleurochrysis_carterae.AAC.2